MESVSKPDVKEKLESHDVGQDSKDGVKRLNTPDLLKKAYSLKWLPRVLQTQDMNNSSWGSKDVPEPHRHSPLGYGNVGEQTSKGGDVVIDSKSGIQEESASWMKVEHQAPKPVERSPTSRNKYNVPDLPSLTRDRTHCTTADHKKEADSKIVSCSSKYKDAGNRSESRTKDRNWSEEKTVKEKPPKRKQVDENLPKKRKILEKPKDETETGKDENETNEKGPVESGGTSRERYRVFDVRDRHPKCTLTLEEVIRKADTIPACLGTRPRLKYVRKIYKHGRDPDSWNWSQYDYAVLLTESLIVVKDVPHRNCHVPKHELRKMGRDLPNLESKECFVFLCFYRGLDPGKVLRQIKKNPLCGSCPEPWKALREYRNPQNSGVELRFCKETEMFRCVEVELKTPCDHLLCSARGDPQKECLLTMRNSKNSSVSPFTAGGDFKPANAPSTLVCPADLPGHVSSKEEMSEDALAFIPQPACLQNQADVIQAGAGRHLLAENPGSMLNSLEAGNQPLSPLPLPPRSPQSLLRTPAMPQPRTSNSPPHPLLSSQSSEPVEMDWTELESADQPLDEYHPNSCDTTSPNDACTNKENLAINSNRQNLFESPQVYNQESPSTTGSEFKTTVPLLPCTSSAMEKESSGTLNRPVCSGIIVFVEPIDYPKSRLSDEQMRAIESSILDLILEMPVEGDGVGPQFLQSTCSNGRFEVTCCDDFSRKWLYAFLGTHKPCPGVSLRIVSKDFRTRDSPLPHLLPSLDLRAKDCGESSPSELQDQPKSIGTTTDINMSSIDDRKDPAPPEKSSAMEELSRIEPGRRLIRVFIEPNDYPNSHLSDEQMTILENSIVTVISEMGKNDVRPTFLQSIRRDGRYGVTCSEDFSRKWLYAYLGTHKPWPNSSLRIVSKELTEIRARAILPLCEDERNEIILKLIGKLNDGLNVNKWEVVKRWENDSKTYMDLVIDEESSKVLENLSRIVFKTGTGQIVTDRKKNLISEGTIELKESSGLDSSADRNHAELFKDINASSAEFDEPAEFGLLEQSLPSECRDERRSWKESGDSEPPKYFSSSQTILSPNYSWNSSGGCSSNPSFHNEVDPSVASSAPRSNDDEPKQPDHPLPVADLETHFEEISSPISYVQLSEDTSTGAHSSKDSCSMDGGSHDHDQDSSSSPISFQYDPAQPMQDFATEQFRKLIAAGYSCQEALKITQDFVSRHLNDARPERPMEPSTSKQPKLTLSEVASDKFHKLVAAGFSNEKALLFTRAFVKRQMGLLPPPAFRP